MKSTAPTTTQVNIARNLKVAFGRTAHFTILPLSCCQCDRWCFCFQRICRINAKFLVYVVPQGIGNIFMIIT